LIPPIQNTMSLKDTRQPQREIIYCHIYEDARNRRRKTAGELFQAFERPYSYSCDTRSSLTELRESM
jgi:hypothetical protein